MVSDSQLVEYLKTSLAQGHSKEDIYKWLLHNGWGIDAIEEAFRAIGADHEKQKEKEDISKKTIRIIVITGAVLVGAGIFSFIAANWLGMPKPVKIGIILATMIACYAVGWYVKEKLKLLKTGEALMLLGCIIYGAGIFLVAQMFNVRANWPDGFILWMIGAIIIGFAVDSYAIFSLAIPLGMVALVGHPFGLFSRFIGYNSFLLTSSFLLVIATGLTFFAGWTIRKKMPPELKEFY